MERRNPGLFLRSRSTVVRLLSLVVLAVLFYVPQAFASIGCLWINGQSGTVSAGEYFPILVGGPSINQGDLITVTSSGPVEYIGSSFNFFDYGGTASGTDSGSATPIEGIQNLSSSAVTYSITCVSVLPTITSVSPSTGLPGTSVTITGTGFYGTAVVEFGATRATSFTVNSGTSITAVVPAGTGTVPISVLTDSGMSFGPSFTFLVPPSVTSVSPITGLPGTSVTITGTGFSGATAVNFGGTPATSFTVNSDTWITAVVPAGTGTVPVSVTTTTGGSGSGGSFTFQASAGSLNQPMGVAVDGSGNLYIADITLPYIVRVPAGCSSQSCETQLGSGFSTPAGVAVDGAGNVFVIDARADDVVELPWNASTGVFGTSVTLVSGLSLAQGQPAGIAVDGSGNVYVTDTLNHQVSELALTSSGYGASQTVFSNSGFDPTGVAVDGDGNLYIATGSHSLIEVTGSTQTTLVGGSGSSASPFSVAIGNDGNLYYSDTTSAAVTMLPRSGTAFGTAVPLGSGWSMPYGLAVNGAGNIFVADSGAKSVSEVKVATPPSLTFASTAVGSTSSDQVVTLENLGNASLTFPIPTVAGGTNPSLSTNFTLSSGTCPQLTTTSGTEGTLAAGATCTLPLSFTPTATGSISGSLVLTDNSLNVANATEKISLSGTASLPAGPTTATVTPNPAYANENVTFTATVIVPITPASGTVTFTSGSTVICTTGLTGTTGNSCTTTLAPGNYSVAANYSGDGANPPSMSDAVALTVYSVVTARQQVSSAIVTTGHSITSFSPIAGSGGTGTFTYGISPSLPSGLTLNTTTGAVTGTPSAASPSTIYTVTVTDSNGKTASGTFSLTVNGPVTASTAVVSTSLTQNHAATPFTPVTGNGGTTPLSYSVSPALPTGLSMNSSTGTVSGTPAVTGAVNSYTVTVTDANGATATANFSLTVNSHVAATQTTASAVLTQNHAATFTPVAGSGGTTPLTYSISPILPAGLSLNSSTGAISGTPTAASAATTYTITNTDANGASATATFSLTVNSAVAATAATSSQVLTSGQSAVNFTPVTGSGGTGTLTYSISPALLAGLSFDTSTGAISGTASASVPATTFTVTVTDANGGNASATFSLTVNAVVTATTALPTTVLTYNSAASFTPVTGSGGTGALTYSISPTLPAGLSFNASSGSVTGTPTALSAATTYTVTVTDTNHMTASTGFSLSIAKATPTVSWTAPASVSYGAALSATQLNASASVPGTFTYSMELGTVLSPGTYTLTASFTPTDSTDYAVPAIATVSLTVTKAPVTVAVAVSSASIVAGQPVTLTSTVASATGTPTGTISFYNGTTLLGSAVVISGQATLAFTPSAGSYAITASYNGDTNFLTDASPSTTLSVGSPDFTLTAPSTAFVNPLIPGHPLTFTFSVAANYGNFSVPVSFNVSGLPPGATATFTPATIAAGSSGGQVQITIQAAPTTSSLNRSYSGVTVALLLLPLASFRRFRRLGAKWLLVLLLMLTGLTTLTGCGSSMLPNYNATVTASSGQFQHSFNVFLEAR